MMTAIYAFSARNLQGDEVSLQHYQGNVLLIVNTASTCGFTPQYEGLQALYEEFHNQGFEIPGFPSNQFANQEPGSEADIASFCAANYGVTFPMFSKIKVNGKETHPLFRFLKDSLPGSFGMKRIKWNFTKFLVSLEGKPLNRYAPSLKPEDMVDDIRAAQP